MEVTNIDRHYYFVALEDLTQRFEIEQEFVKNNGIACFPMEELTDLMIVGIKEWLISNQGESWLSTLGYVKQLGTPITISGCIHICISGSLCPVCSGSFYHTHGYNCENCGKFVCEPCASIVDPLYHIAWCSDCLADKPLTNLLVYNE